MAFLANSTSILQISHPKAFKMRYTRCWNNNLIWKYSQFHFMYGSNFYESDFKFEMSFWCHRFDQKNNKKIVRISAMKVCVASMRLPWSFLGLSVGFLIKWHYLLSPQEAPKSFQKSLQHFCCYFGRNDDIKKIIRY